MSLFRNNALFIIYMVTFVMFAAFVELGGQKDNASQGSTEHSGGEKGSPAMVHMRHADLIKSEEDFLREMIPHHQEAVDTSILLFVTTNDPELRKLSKSIYTTQNDEILDMRISFARWYNRIPTGAGYMPMMRDLNAVTGKKRDIRFVHDMIRHHEGAVEMAEKVLTFEDIHSQTVTFAKSIIKNQAAEIKVMQDWLKKHKNNR